MQQLTAALAAAPCWGFSVAYDTDHSPAPAPLMAPGMALPDLPGKRGGSGSGWGSAAGSGSAGGSGGGFGGSRVLDAVAGAGEAGAAGVEPSQEDGGGQTGGRQQQLWSWSVLGVAFSVADGCAFYVPLTRQLKAGGASSVDPGAAANAAAASAAGDAMRVGTGKRLRQLWDGLSAIFAASSSRSSTSTPGEQQQHQDTSVRAVAAAAQAAGKPLLGAYSPAAAAGIWMTPGPVAATYALKAQLQALASPPVLSGLRGFVLRESLVDVRIAAWLLHPDDKTCEEDRWGAAPGRKPLTKGLEALLQKWGCAQDVADAVGELPRSGGGASSGRHLHACRRACMALKLHRILAPMLQSESVLPALMGMEMPLVRLLAAMEAHGIALDPAVLDAQEPAMVKRLGQLEAAAAKHNRGVKFNLSSPADVRMVLFEKLKLPPRQRPQMPRAATCPPTQRCSTSSCASTRCLASSCSTGSSPSCWRAS
ncbi:hypothetical protein COO60DRAFT_857223 [Scenedesmus sp. NREL 46B-D3]|nr:hypothetical protein COO60DRAFT_857223 [Scenedesmus sp. NREL 46B-D3]